MHMLCFCMPALDTACLMDARPTSFDSAQARMSQTSCC